MSYTFEDAAPVKIEGAGRKAEPNPFEDIVKAIALKTDDKGQAVAKSFSEEFENDEDRKKIVARIRALMTRAGDSVEPEPVTVRVVNGDVKDEKGKVIKGVVRFTFWTTKKKARTVATATASTEQSTAVAEPK